MLLYADILNIYTHTYMYIQYTVHVNAFILYALAFIEMIDMDVKGETFRKSDIYLLYILYILYIL